jgi:hypothetical protein
MKRGDSLVVFLPRISIFPQTERATRSMHELTRFARYLYTGDSQHLPFAHIERNVVDGKLLCAFKTCRFSTLRITLPGLAVFFFTFSSTSRLPSCWRVSSCRLLWVGRTDHFAAAYHGDAVCTFHHLAQLCVMKMIDFPCSTRICMILNSSSTSWGVRTADGSSMIKISASRKSSLIISTLCCVPTGRSRT